MGITQGPKYVYERLIPKWRLWKISEPEKYGRGPLGLLKNAYGEQPMVTLTAFIALFSFCGIVKKNIENSETHYSENNTYKKFYTVMRPDDPRVSRTQEQWAVTGAPATFSSSARMA